MASLDKTVHTRHAEIALRETSGKGMPVLLIHGSGSSKDVFAKQMESPLADIYRMIAIDLPGHGSSSNPADAAATYTVTGLADVVEDVLTELGIGRVAIYGWSLGGHIAMQLMSSRQDIAGVMLTGAPPVSPGPLGMLRGFHAHWDMLLASKENFTPRDAERFSRLCFGEDGTPAFLEAIARTDGRIRPIFNKSLMRGDGADQRRTVEQSSMPVAMINGADDASIRLGYVASLNYPNLWDNRCHAIAGAGHSPFWQVPDVFNLLFLRFLADVSVRKPMEVGAEETLSRSAQ